MRPFKDSTRQQWKFVNAGSTNNFYIQNVKTNEYLGYTSVNSVYRVYVSSQTSWTIELDGDSYFIKYTSNSGYRFLTNASSQVLMSGVTTGYDNERWKLLPVNPPPIDNNPLGTGYYRIRSFNGLYLMTMPTGDESEDKNAYIKSQDSASNLFQRWLVTRQTNGLYVILSSGNTPKRYLGCAEGQTAQGDNTEALDKPFEWCIQSTGLSSAFLVTLPQSKLSLGFSNYLVDSDEDVCLEPSDDIPSQLWFFEKYFPFGSEKVHAKRIPDIPDGKYLIQNCHDSTVYMTYLGTAPVRITSGLSTGKAKFSLKYKDANSATFTLTYDEVSSDTPPVTTYNKVADVGGYLNIGETATSWVFLQEQANDPGYYICRPDSGYPRRVISNRLFTAVNKNKYFAIDNMVKGDTTQMWKLVSA
jgi:hypothetical protein